MNVGASEPSELALLKEQLEAERAKVRALEDIGVALGSTLDLNELLALVVARVSQVVASQSLAVEFSSAVAALRPSGLNRAKLAFVACRSSTKIFRSEAFQSRA